MSYDKGSKVPFSSAYSIYARCVRGGAIHSAPSAIALTPDTLPENAEAGTVVGTLVATDADAGDSHTFALTCNDTAFSVTPEGTLVSNVPFDYDTTPTQTVCVRATDSYGLIYDQEVTVTILAQPRIEGVDFTNLSPVMGVNGSYHLAFSVNHPEGEYLAVSVSSDNPSLVQVSPASQEVDAAGYEDLLDFALTAGGGTTGTARITVTVSGSSGTTTKTFEIEVRAGSPLNPAVLLYLLD